MNKNQVSIVANKNGQFVTAYESNPDYGYILVTSVESVFIYSWLVLKPRNAVIKGKVEALNSIALMGSLPGKIVVTECLENNILAQFSAQFDKSLSFEEQITPFIKRAGENGPVLTQQGVRILRFTEYDPTCSKIDIRVEHDNIAEIKAYNLTKSTTGTAKL
jgi:hypothetical protein